MMLIISIVVITSLQTAYAFPTALKLERASTGATNHPPVFGFPLEGSINPYHVGLYYTRVQLGSPPREYYVQIDTGSSDVWVGCHACHTCPTSSRLGIPIHLYDPSASSTASLIKCSADRRCSIGNSTCSASNKRCSYMFEHLDGSTTSGYYVSDQMHLDAVSVNPTSSINASASIVFFGCSMNQTGYLRSSSRAVDGIFGFGPQGSSVISQLSSQGVTPNAFSHCLVGTGGGILVLDRIVDPNLVYTPLIPSHCKHERD